MEKITSPAAMTAWADSRRAEGKKICLVPTMGFFHEGHLSLMRKGAKIADEVVVSLFVNPIQFAPGEDLDSYPRAFEQDAGLAEKNGAVVLFAPEVASVYPEGFCSRVEVDGITDQLCGASRPGHFSGVTTIVAKLFNMVKPHSAVFGEKDFQQLAVIRRMASDLNFDVEIIGYPIVREPDGLAMSSRNSYLSDQQREHALCLSQSMQVARQKVAEGEKNAAGLQEQIRNFILEFGEVTIDYVSIVNCRTLEFEAEISSDSLLALAVKIGKTRLIDNTLLGQQV